ncbi:acyl-CoA dehydrogenase family protein [Rhizobium rhizogenes]|uniref:Dibenzothiophene monooxygenase n=1 Tax=Rhizobium rhizogenes (strain K84 / ATCC BAA-868) TaxID=311403 RepID=B9JPV5_RHIR8|nr:Acyl-CoA dehydrogenase, C-terminal:Acyl-CoA dehydrogenase, central region:Acyl-CoA dehydrogenase, N-terminal:Acyl-CoA dehydrogenase, N-terminal [Rhizobium rhizogenes K84]
MPQVQIKPLHDEAINQLRELTNTLFREEGVIADRDGVIPFKSLRAIYDLGLWHASASKSLGGRGGSLTGEEPGLFLELLRTVCSGDSPTGHCYQLHNHALWQLETVGTPAQIERFLKPNLEKFSLFAAVGSEPGRVNMYEMKTRARKVDGGFIVNGVKNFVTNGGAADIIITSVALDDASSYFDNLQMMLIEPGMDGVTFDDDWYRPHGMRSARSPIMRLEDVFVPDIHALGEPGAFARQRWQGRFHLGFAANYLGSAEGLFDWFLQYTRTRNRSQDPIIQLRTGEMKLQLDAASALFEEAVRSWSTKSTVEAELRSMSAKSFAARAAFDVVRSILYTAGATAQFEEHPLGRSVRNLETHVVHAGHDRTAQIIGQAQLGVTFDSTLQR